MMRGRYEEIRVSWIGDTGYAPQRCASRVFRPANWISQKELENDHAKQVERPGNDAYDFDCFAGWRVQIRGPACAGEPTCRVYPGRFEWCCGGTGQADGGGSRCRAGDRPGSNGTGGPGSGRTGGCPERCSCNSGGGRDGCNGCPTCGYTGDAAGCTGGQPSGGEPDRDAASVHQQCW